MLLVRVQTSQNRPERRPRKLFAVRGIEVAVRPSTITADTPIVAASALVPTALPSVQFAKNLLPGATANALRHLHQLLPLLRRPDVSERRTLALSWPTLVALDSLHT